MATGIRDKVAIIGMGCSKFGERWDCGGEDLIVEAFEECANEVNGVTGGDIRKEIQAAWFATCMPDIHVGQSALPLPMTLRLPNIAVTRVENFCASGTEALRGAAYAVASGAYEVCLAQGVEKLKDTGYGGLPEAGSNGGSLNWLVMPKMTAPGAFAILASGYAAKYGVDLRKEVKKAMAHVSFKSHQNGVNCEKAHLRKAVPEAAIMSSPIIADPVGLFDCCGVSDGSACAIVTTPEKAKEMGFKDFITIKALQLALSNGEEAQYSGWDYAHFPTTTKAAKMAYAEAGIKNPREEVSCMEVHDCFSITELITYEDLGMSERGQAWKDSIDGVYDMTGEVPCQTDGGLKCFGHPIAASGLRMMYEMYNQIHGRCGERQLKDPTVALTHNLGGFPFMNISCVAIVGKHDA